MFVMQHYETWQRTVDRRTRLRDEARRWHVRDAGKNGEDLEVTAPRSSFDHRRPRGRT